jgi:uncharacterized SAM-binding protein YcdF (DUF218 family)
MALTLVAVGLAVLITALWDFGRRMETTAHHPGLSAQAAIVFTGQFNRVREGLDLLERSEIRQLFVSGVNRKAGMTPARFVAQFELDRSSQEALAEGRLVLGPAARSTFQNVSETRCWLQSQGVQGPVLLITSARHMPRASVALERALPNLQVLRLSVSDGPTGLSTFAKEFMKYLATLSVTRIPLLAGWLMGDVSHTHCDGGPSTSL